MVVGLSTSVFLQSTRNISRPLCQKPTLFKNEKWTQPADHHDTRGQFNPAVHSTDGINSVSLDGYPWPIFQNHVIQTTREFPEEFPFNLDFNSGQMLGVGTFAIFNC